MYYENSMKITLANDEIAAAALDVLKARLTAGFDCDKSYKRAPSMLMHDALEVAGNTITLPDDFGCCIPEDAAKVIPELMQYLAAHISAESFTFTACNSSDYDEGWFYGSYENNELKIKATYLPSGFGNYYCPECGEVIATMQDDEEGNLFVECKVNICPECGEGLDLSDWTPIIIEQTFQIA